MLEVVFDTEKKLMFSLTMYIDALIQTSVASGNEDAVAEIHHCMPTTREMHGCAFVPCVVPA